jgi:hypothetical protein
VTRVAGGQPYSGFEPQVGEIRALRTFRIGPGGLLYPLFGAIPWTAGTNTSACRALESVAGVGAVGGGAGIGGAGRFGDAAARSLTHVTPEPDCSCGYYAYADEASAEQYPQARNVLAVVACWGRVVAGTRGVRAQYARIESVWMSDRVPPSLAAEVAQHYQQSQIYRDKNAMLNDYELTRLDCYEPQASDVSRYRRFIVRATVLAALAVGAIPANVVRHDQALLVLWWSALSLVLSVALYQFWRRKEPQSLRAALLYTALALWLVASFGGGVGLLLLRLPILQMALLSHLYRVRMSREANRFPAAVSDA